MAIEAPIAESYFRSDRREMLQFIPSECRYFLEIGCGSGIFGELLRREIKGAHVVGVETDPDAAKDARKRLDRVLELPIESALPLLLPQSVDCVVCNDVLEHLVDPWAALRELHRVLKAGGCVVASIPNVRYFPVFHEYFIDGEWQYREAGVLDRTHLRFFTRASIDRLFIETGYEVNILQGIRGQPLPWKAALLNRLLRHRLDDMKFERFACVATIRVP